MKSVFRCLIVLLCVFNVTAQVPTIQWQKCLGGFRQEEVDGAIITDDNGSLILGRSDSYDGDVDVNIDSSTIRWLTKVSGSGSIMWQKAIDTTNFLANIPAFLLQVADGNYAAAYGETIKKLDTSGNVIWTQSYANDIDVIASTPDSGFIVVPIRSTTMTTTSR